MKRRLASLLLAITVTFCGICLPTAADDRLEIREYIKEAFYSFEPSVDVSGYGIDPDELSALFVGVIKDDPYLFFVDPHLSYTYKKGGHVLTLKPKYKMSQSEALEAMDFCRARIAEIAEMTCNMTCELEKALFFHDYICNLFSYDSDHTSTDMYSFLTTGEGTCQGYAHTYAALLRQVGIDTAFAASDTISHIWNLVMIDGDWYHVDLTWDDSGGEISRRHFLCSDAVAEERGHRDWYSVTDIFCLSDKYSNYDFDLIKHGLYGSGDVDHSGSLDVRDVVHMRRLLTQYCGAVSERCIRCADLDGDGACEADDLLLLREKILLSD